MNQQLKFRRGSATDEDWLFELFRDTMQEYIDAAWGWDELMQREGFVTSLPAANFIILERDNERLGCYHLSQKVDHMILDMILVVPHLQRQGFGRLMMQHIQQQAKLQQLPVHLSVLQSNPARGFHAALGFEEFDRDEHSLKLNWIPD